MIVTLTRALYSGIESVFISRCAHIVLDLTDWTIITPKDGQEPFAVTDIYVGF